MIIQKKHTKNNLHNKKSNLSNSVSLLSNYTFSYNKNNLNSLNLNSLNNSKNNSNDLTNDKINETKNYKEPLLSILCINCGNEIPIELIESHSNICIKIKEENINKNNIFSEVNKKLEKLKNNILKYFNNEIKVPESISEELNCFGKELIYLINDSLYLNKAELDIIKNLEIILNEISVLKENNFSFQSIILIERTYVLIKEKLSITKKLYKKLNNLDNSVNLNFEMNKSLNNKFEFYKLVEKIKLEKFPFSHISQKIQSKYLYNEAIKNKIPTEKWSNFIYKKLKKPFDKNILSKTIC
jgi:hypothetical protein